MFFSAVFAQNNTKSAVMALFDRECPLLKVRYGALNFDDSRFHFIRPALSQALLSTGLHG